MKSLWLPLVEGGAVCHAPPRISPQPTARTGAVIATARRSSHHFHGGAGHGRVAAVGGIAHPDQQRRHVYRPGPSTVTIVRQIHHGFCPCWLPAGPKRPGRHGSGVDIALQAPIGIR